MEDIANQLRTQDMMNYKFWNELGKEFSKHLSKSCKGSKIDHNVSKNHFDKNGHQIDENLFTVIYIDNNRYNIGWGWSISIINNQWVLRCGNSYHYFIIGDPYSIGKMKGIITRNYRDHMKWERRRKW